ncbi:MAG: FUSC family protein [Bacteroidetes bacterium]|nr:FUSC family protein [Bacteroidota bacterium]
MLSYFNNLSAGVVLSIGAMCVANTDNPGPIHHRRNGMIACVLIIFLVTLLIGWASGSHTATGCLVFIFCFVFSLMSIYGNRASSIGVNALLVMVLNIDRPHHGWDILINAAYVLAGGIWYTVLSLLLYSFRPYKLVQQALGDCVHATAGYLRIKASFYSREVDYDKSYRQLVDSQVSIHEKQDLVRELLFKSRNIVQESTHIGRVLLMMFLDTIDLFERIMTSQQDYEQLHRFFDDSELMEDCRKLILELASELDEIGIALMSGKPSEESARLSIHIREVRESFSRYRDRYRTAENVEGFIGLRNILDSIEDIGDRLHTLHGYTTYDRKLSKNFRSDLDYEDFVSHEDVSYKLLLDNLTIKSNVFRHSLRVSIATLAGYIIAGFLPFGHGYWILLTVIVILKPMYSLSKRRNFERLMGTLAGALVGLLILYFIKDPRVLFVLMILFMIGTYVFIRTNYLVCVTLMTPYVLLLFHLLYPTDFRTILSDRVIDTIIGSALAFLANILIIPSWEHERITDYMTAALEANAAYFRDVASAFLGKPASVHQYKLSRKQAFVALANLSDAFGRMLNEPRRQQKKITEMHQFVVANHMLTSHTATLAYYVGRLAARHGDPAYRPLVDHIDCLLGKSVAILQDKELPEPSTATKEDLRLLNDRLNKLMEQRKAELEGRVTTGEDTRKELSEFKPMADQFNYILKDVSEIEKLSTPLHVGLTSEQEVGYTPLF